MQERAILANVVLSTSPPKIALATRHLDQTYPSKEAVIASVLRPKQITKSCHEHHVYVIMHVMECVDNIFVT